MRNGSGFVIVIVGLLLLWVAVSGKYACIEGAFACLLDTGQPAPQPTPNTSAKPSQTGAIDAGGLFGGDRLPTLAQLAGTPPFV